MNRLSDRVTGWVIGLALAATGVVLWAKGQVDLPTRHGEWVYRSTGASLFFLGLGPVLAGIALFLAVPRIRSEDRPVDPRNPRDPFTFTFLVACASFLLGVFLTKRV